jgi:formimidoylglutamate deiminase
MAGENARGVRCPSVWLAEGWRDDVALCFDAAGRISEIGGDPSGLPLAPGPVVAGMGNAHSHAFQWAMAGLGERASLGDDSFWTWRAAMYGFVEAMAPEDVEALAAVAYVAMLEAGFTRVAEFHYVHHRPDGGRYAQPEALSLAIVRAAQRAGLGLTLLPVLYRYGGVGGQPASAAQRRFLGDPRFVLDVRDAVARVAPEVVVGAALHSLRAVTAPDVHALLDALGPDVPLHLHIAEQQAEVDACVEVLGARPVAWLADHVQLSPRWSLVHATHVNPSEVATLAATNTTVVLCPTTEANLGDGVFPAERFLRLGGTFAVGTDSHVGVDPAQELRLLELGQRLTLGRRNVLRVGEGGHVGAGLWSRALQGGASALGQGARGIAVGQSADLVALRGDDVRLVGRTGHQIVDTWVMAGGASLVEDVWVGGRRVVHGGRHPLREDVATAYRRALIRMGR